MDDESKELSQETEDEAQPMEGAESSPEDPTEQESQEECGDVRAQLDMSMDMEIAAKVDALAETVDKIYQTVQILVASGVDFGSATSQLDPEPETDSEWVPIDEMDLSPERK